MTWNVHGTFNLNPDFDLEGVSAIIGKWSPDVVALQEVDSRGRADDPFARLADVVGEHRAEARSIVTKDGDYGQVLLSKLPFAAPPVISDSALPASKAHRDLYLDRPAVVAHVMASLLAHDPPNVLRQGHVLLPDVARPLLDAAEVVIKGWEGDVQGLCSGLHLAESCRLE